MYYRTFFKRVIYTAFDEDHHHKVENIIERIQKVVQRYIVGIFTVVLILTILNTTGLLLIGINYAFFLAL